MDLPGSNHIKIFSRSKFKLFFAAIMSPNIQSKKCEISHPTWLNPVSIAACAKNKISAR